MANMNKVFLIGNLTRDPELRRTPSGMAVADMRLAVGRKFKSGDGSLKEETCYVSVTVWDRQAETVKEYLHKGSPALVEGRLKYEEWEKNGQKQNRLVVVAERVQFLGGARQRSETGTVDEPAVEESSEPPAPDNREKPASGDHDDLPF